MSLEGRTALITGASRGLGAEIARHFVAAGASVMLVARNKQALEGLAHELAPLTHPGARIETHTCDLSQFIDIERLCMQTLAAFPRLDILVNNAGSYGPFGALEDVDWDEWVEAIGLNLLSPAFLCRVLVPHMKTNNYGKIINLSGGGATSPLPRISSYAAAKAGLVRFSETLAHELLDFGIDVNSVAPGAMDTRMNQDLLATEPSIIGEAFYARIKAMVESGGTPPARGAEACVYLASAASDGITGRLISAVWDPVQTLERYKADMSGSDIYTLRRIVPADRGKDWGN